MTAGRGHERRKKHRERRESLLARLAESEVTLQSLRKGADFGHFAQMAYGEQPNWKLVVEQEGS